MKKILTYALPPIILITISLVVSHYVYKNGGSQLKEWSCDGREIEITCLSNYPAKLPDTCYYLCLGEPYISTDVSDILEELDFYQDSEGFRNIYR